MPRSRRVAEQHSQLVARLLSATKQGQSVVLRQHDTIGT